MWAVALLACGAVSVRACGAVSVRGARACVRGARAGGAGVRGGRLSSCPTKKTEEPGLVVGSRLAPAADLDYPAVGRRRHRAKLLTWCSKSH